MKFIIAIIALGLATSLVCSAPTEDTSTKNPETSSTAAMTTDTSSTKTPNTEASSTMASMAVSSAQDQAQAHVANTTFTCHGKLVGYYADIEAQCKIYHFCMPGNYDGQEVYQRISYMCLNDTLFDQQALDCVEASKMSDRCQESQKYYDDSNAILRKAIVSQTKSDGSMEGDKPKEAGKEAADKPKEEQKSEEKKTDAQKET
jgi:hypothetical protein